MKESLRIKVRSVACPTCEAPSGSERPTSHKERWNAYAATRDEIDRGDS